MGHSIHSPRFIHRSLVLLVCLSLFVVLRCFWTYEARTSTISSASNLLFRQQDGPKSRFTNYLWPGHSLMNATFVSLVRNGELEGMLDSIHDVETRFNHNYHYDWVFLNDDTFTEEFKIATTAATSGRVSYGKINHEQWSYPAGLNMSLVEQSKYDMGLREDIPYGNSSSYRHMCRYQSGFFYRHPLVLEYEWYWRVEPGIEILCDIPYDPFAYMAEHGKKYAFVISINEISDTVRSLWSHVRTFMEEFPQHISKDNHMAFLSEDGGITFNHCHFWDNFEIASLEWYRGEAYNDFFSYLDQSGGFFYERWGDASIHSIAASLMLDKGEIHFFDDIGYHHYPTKSCPRSAHKQKRLNCRCNEQDNTEWYPSCAKRFFDVTGIEYPEGSDRNVPKEAGLVR
ncbi:hypothetical protein AC579_7014 [Pseudocercospora musae]|uniref:Glycosyltransferase family 15 protein n=1 Tax=Pseudocercospora musae TaxID=113226 RepID=A0A139GXL8_9PEZI|nr:hypothetical protein AC579_7014 [Pseudocercospora musae]